MPQSYTQGVHPQACPFGSAPAPPAHGVENDHPDHQCPEGSARIMNHAFNLSTSRRDAQMPENLCLTASSLQTGFTHPRATVATSYFRPSPF